MQLKKLSITDIANNIENKRILVRVDYNVPLCDGKITSAKRITATIPTLEFLLKHKPKSLVLMSHCGRPDGQKDMSSSLKPCAELLQSLLKKEVKFLPDCVGPEVESACANPTPGSVILLENLRFHVEEEGKGKSASGESVKASKEDVEKFRASLSKLGDIFVNDAFGTAHRAHSSMVGINHEIRACGFLLEKELESFGKVLQSPERPFLAILGGAKVKDKILLIENMLDIVDRMIIGGGMAYTFLKVLENMKIGDSLYDEEGSKRVRAIMEKAESRKVQIMFPVDFVIANEYAENPSQISMADREDGIPDNFQGLDSGPKTAEHFKTFIISSKTILWNGPQGKFEWPKFRAGSVACLEYIVEATKRGAISIAGGGDTVSLIELNKMESAFTHVSTGGGASLELLEGKQLPGVLHLSDKQ